MKSVEYGIIIIILFMLLGYGFSYSFLVGLGFTVSRIIVYKIWDLIK